MRIMQTATRGACGNQADGALTLKHGLCQIETERQQAIAVRYDHDGEIVKGAISDPWKPLRDLRPRSETTCAKDEGAA